MVEDKRSGLPLVPLSDTSGDQEKKLDPRNFAGGRFFILEDDQD